MRYFSGYFWVSSFLFTANQLFEKYLFPIPWVHAYLDDVLCAGIVLGFALFVQQQFSFRKASYTFSWGHAAFFVFWYTFLFEVMFPIWDNRHHSDPWDMVAYFAGAWIFMKLGNKEAPSLIDKSLFGYKRSA